MRVRSNAKEFKYVTAKKTRRNIVYTGVVRVSGTRSNKYFARGDTPAEAANMVVEYWKCDVNAIRLNRAQRHAPEESTECLAVFERRVRLLGAGGRDQRSLISRAGILHADVRAIRLCGRLDRQGG